MEVLSVVMVVLAVDGGVTVDDGGLPPPGDYWVARPGPLGGTGRFSLDRDGGGLVAESSVQLMCERLRVDRSSLSLVDSAITLTVSRGLIADVTLQSRSRAAARVKVGCRSRWPANQPFYASAEACHADTPAWVQKRCIDQRCEWVTRAPFQFEGCEAAITQAAARLHVGLEPTHTEALKTLQRFEAVLVRGGSMFVAPGCEPMKFSPRDAEGTTRLSTTNEWATYEALGQVHPLFGEARYASEVSNTDAGQSWGRGRGADTILLGKDRVLLGERSLYFERERCRAP